MGIDAGREHSLAVLVGGTNVEQSGEIEVRALAAVAFNEALTNSADGLITLWGGALAAAGVTNEAGANILGFGMIDGSLTNDGDAVTIADMQIVGDLNNEGTIIVQSGLLTVTGDVSGGGTIIGGFGARDGEPSGLRIHGNLDLTVQDWRQIDLTQAVIEMSGDLVGVQTLEVAAVDRGRSISLPATSLFSIGTLRIGPTPTTVRLVDRNLNSPTSRCVGAEALYVDHLILEPGVTLDLAGLRLYYGTVSPADLHVQSSGIAVIDSVGGGGLYRIEKSRLRACNGNTWSPE